MNDQTKALKPIDDIRISIQQMEPQFKMALPSQIAPEKFIRVTMTAIQMNPELLNADRKSLFSSCMKAAADGLLPDGREAALVTYKTKTGIIAAYLPMIGGILKKIRNSGDLAMITAQIIFKNDQFRYWVDDAGEHVNHEPLLFGDRGDPIGVYALAKTTDGAVYIETMTKNQVMAVRAVSRAQNGPWSGPFEHEMWRKTAIRRLSKRLPMSTDVETVIQRDDELYDINKADHVQIEKGKQLEKLLDNKSIEQAISDFELFNNPMIESEQLGTTKENIHD